MALIIAIYPFLLTEFSGQNAHIYTVFVTNNVAKSLKELVFDPPE